MKVKILYFAAVREMVRKDEEELELPPSVATVGDLASYLAQVHVSLAGRLASVRLARNETFATNDERLEEGDVIALIPPIAGG
jgi:molybdopterin synthase sulfur carrier subunit